MTYGLLHAYLSKLCFYCIVCRQIENDFNSCRSTQEDALIDAELCDIDDQGAAERLNVDKVSLFAAPCSSKCRCTHRHRHRHTHKAQLILLSI